VPISLLLVRRISRLGLALVLSAAENATLPEPPQQHQPWQPVASALPAYVPELVELLFDAGLADPRGGQYRQIEFRSSPREAAPFHTHGWYFSQGFAVGWDGLVHRVEHAGEKADLASDVAASHEKFWREATPTAPPDAELVGIALMLRLGEPELAHQMSLRVQLPAEFKPPADDEGARSEKIFWFEMAGTSWLGGIFHEAVEAHARGDDELARDMAGFLLAQRPAFESAWRSLGPVEKPDSQSPAAFLNDVPALLADSERRLQEPRRSPLDAEAIRRMPQSARIAALIDRLEDMDEKQISQPGGVWIMGSPICKMLAGEGVDAVDALLDALDHDTRLTRSYSCGRNFLPARHLISVSEAALAVLQEDYHLDIARWSDPSERRAWFIRNKFKSQAERALDLLADDSNSEIQWLDAAHTLLRISQADAGAELRERHNPSVTGLMAQRAAEMKSSWAYDMGLLLYQWDPPAALPVLQLLAHAHVSPSPAGNGRIAAARLALGDVAAAREWVDAIEMQWPPTASNRIVDLEHLAPLWTSPGNEELKAFARQLFTDPGAPMSPVRMLLTGGLVGELFRSPLLIEDVFREAVLAALSRTEEIGSVERGSDGMLHVRVGISTISSGRDLDRPPVKQSIRIRDFIASELSNIEGFPGFSLEWSSPEKDAAAVAMAEFLRKHAGELRGPPLGDHSPLGPVVLAGRK
jgi:hypothetical protein